MTRLSKYARRIRTNVVSAGSSFRLARPKLLDVVDRLDVEDHPNLLEPVRRMERDADPGKCRLDPLELRQAAQPTSRTSSLAQRREVLLDDQLDRREELLRTRTDNALARNVDKRRSPRLKDAPRLPDERVDRKFVRVVSPPAATR